MWGGGGRHPPPPPETSLQIAEGEFVALVGSSGCGKSSSNGIRA
jgi:ABC-type lipoprotein export system ATPase subunit